MAAVQAADVERMGFQLALRRRGISDQAVLRAMDEVPREYFVAPEFTDSAYADQALPIACGQTISQPYVVGYMTERLEVAPEHRVLEIGAGSAIRPPCCRGSPARWSHRALQTWPTSPASALKRSAKATSPLSPATVFGRAGARAVRPHHRHRRRGRNPKALVEQLGEGGKLVLPLGPRNGTQYIVRLTKAADGTLTREDLIAVRFVPLLPGQAREL